MPRKITLTPCRCAAFSVLLDVTEDPTTGDLSVGERLTTGCPGTLTGKDFAPGHDAKLKGYLIRWGVAGYEVTYNDGGMAVTGSPIGIAERFGFAHLVRQGIAAGIIKAETRKVRKGERSELAEKATQNLADRVAAEEAAHEEAERTAREAQQNDIVWDEDSIAEEEERAAINAEVAQELAAPVEIEDDTDDVEPVKAKVGRWVYVGHVDGDEFVYFDKNGAEKRTTKFVRI